MTTTRSFDISNNKPPSQPLYVYLCHQKLEVKALQEGLYY